MSSERPGPTVSVVPAYNSDTLLPQLVDRLAPVLARHFGEHELILVDDDSRTDAWRVIERLSSRHAWIRGIHLQRNYGQHNSLVPGFAFLASIIAIFSGVQLFSLGIIGEYLARMHFRSMDRPPYSFRETTGPGSGG